MRVARELTRVADEPRMLVIVANAFLELLVNALIDAKCRHAKSISNNNRDFSYSIKLILLHEMGVLSDASFRRLDWLRRIRNDAAHKAFFSIGKSELSNIIAEATLRDPKRFDLVSWAIVGSLWNEHLDVFVPRFLPCESRKDPTSTSDGATAEPGDPPDPSGT
jgi:hypothetical protein